MELFEKGYLPESDAGLPLKWGDAETLVKLIHQSRGRGRTWRHYMRCLMASNNWLRSMFRYLYCPSGRGGAGFSRSA